MSVRLVLLFLISYLTIVPNKAILSERIIDIYSGNITLEIHNSSEVPCDTPTTTTPLEINTSTMKKPLEINTSSEFLRDTSTMKTPFECPDKDYIGVHCNISNDICIIAKPCRNNGICHANKSLQLQYSCQCPSDEYSGYNCENDNRVCKDNTCWHDGNCINETKALNNKTTFKCICQLGYDGLHCELVDNMCWNITCQNKGRCISSNLSWSCHCLDPLLYSGIYCEHKSSSLITKEILSKSFASVAITAIILVMLFVVIMDILKYGFNIDPVDRERKLMKSEQEEKRRNKKLNKDA